MKEAPAREVSVAKADSAVVVRGTEVRVKAAASPAVSATPGAGKIAEAAVGIAANVATTVPAAVVVVVARAVPEVRPIATAMIVASAIGIDPSFTEGPAKCTGADGSAVLQSNSCCDFDRKCIGSFLGRGTLGD